MNKPFLLSILCGLLALMGTAALQAEAAPVKCSKELLMTFFPAPLVKQVLINHHISPEKAEQISHALARKDQEVVQLVDSKSKQLETNPFQDVEKRDQAVKIFREALYETFSKVLKANGIENDEEIHTMLEDMQAAKGKHLVACMQQQEAQEPTTEESATEMKK